MKKLLRVCVAVGLALGLFLCVGCGDDKGVGPKFGTNTGGTTGGGTNTGEPSVPSTGDQGIVWEFTFLEKYGTDFDDAAKKLFESKYEEGFDRKVANGFYADINKSDIISSKVGGVIMSDGSPMHLIHWVTKDNPYHFLEIEPYFVQYAIDDNGNLYEAHATYVGGCDVQSECNPDGTWKDVFGPNR